MSASAPRYCQCGQRLARDHTGVLCSACERQAAADRSGPPLVPAGFWETPAFRDGFAAQHMGHVARAYRRHPDHVARYGRDGISQERLGGWLGLTQAQVSRIENGPPIRNLDTLAYWAQTLHIPPHLLWFKLPPEASATLPADQVPPASGPGLQPWELADVLTRASLSPATISIMEAQAASLAARYPHTPPAILAPDVRSMLRIVSGALDRSQPLSTRERCVRLAGILAGIAGQLADDTGRVDQSAAWFTTAGLAAAEVADLDLAAWALALRAIGAHFRSEYAQSVALLDQARTTAVTSTARRRAWITALSARGQAALALQQGRTHEARGMVLRTLADSHAILSSAGDSEGGTDFFDESRLTGMSGTALLLLRDTRAARESIRHALVGRHVSDVKGRALLTLDLAECAAAEREPEEAASLAAGALSMTASGIVLPVVRRATAIHQSLHPWESVSAVAVLADQLASVTRTES
jgi:transcriptional regulator with XRE-family HTH domain